MAHLLDMITTAWHRILGDRLSHYRPELHYMRGPGPKWHEKHPDESGAIR